VQVAAAIEGLRREANNHSRSLYQNNKAVHEVMRYGVSAKSDPGKPSEVIHLIDWERPERNDFAIAEEVTLLGGYTRRLDIVLFVNGVAIGVLELKNSRVSIEEGMRHLIDTYIEAKEPRKISPFDDMSLLDIIAGLGVDGAINTLPGSLKRSRDAVAETIENNIRAKMVKERLTDPAFYDKMSKLLDEIIQARKVKALAYEQYLKQIAHLVDTVRVGHDADLGSYSDTRAAGALQQPRQGRGPCHAD
jgi:hypothetical protein